MADRALRGMQIGAKSMESEEGVVFADRFTVKYQTPSGQVFEVTMAAGAVPPAPWESRTGEIAEIVGDVPEEEDAKAAKPVRTHWDKLRERRSIEELDQVLDQQLTLLREGRLRPEGSYRKG